MYIEKFEDAPCIVIYHAALDVDDFIDLIEDEASQSWPYLEWGKSGVGGEISYGEYRTSLEMSLHPISQETENERLVKIQKKYEQNVFKPMNECIWDYRSVYDLQLSRDSGWSVLKYTHDAEYHIHHDHAPDNSRVLSVVASLGSDCEGGELEFPYFKKTFKLEKNDVILFPSNFPYSHIAHPVTSGKKYSLVSWLI
jgi:hypothetical protein